MKMKTSLNPNASCYIPLSKRGKEDTIKPSKVGPEESENGDKTAFAKPSCSSGFVEIDQNPLKGLGKAAWSFDESLNSEDWTRDASASYDSLQGEMDLAFLASNFPNISDQSLADVYSANGCDLEASISMLHELELPTDFTQHPVKYNTPEFGTPAELAIATSGEASGSSSGAAEPAHELQDDDSKLK